MSRMKRFWRWILGGVAVMAVTLWLLYTFVLPGFAEKEITSAIRDVGLGDAQLSVRSISPRGIELADVYLDKERNDHIESLRAEYNIGDLLGSRIKNLTVSGAHLGVGVTDGALDLGPFGKIRLAPTAKVNKGGIPFKTLVIRSSELKLKVGDQMYRLPVDGKIVNEGNRRLSISLNVDIVTPMDLTGTIDLAGNRPIVDLHMATRTKEKDGKPVFALGVSSEQSEAGERWRVTTQGQWKNLEQIISGRHVQATNASMIADVTFDLAGLVHDLDFELNAATAAIDGSGVRALALRAEDNDKGEARIHVAMAGPGWSLHELTVRTPLDPEVWRAGDVTLPIMVSGFGRMTDQAARALLAEPPTDAETMLMVSTGQEVALALSFESGRFDATLEAPMPVAVYTAAVDAHRAAGLLSGGGYSDVAADASSQNAAASDMVDNAKQIAAIQPRLNIAFKQGGFDDETESTSAQWYGRALLALETTAAIELAGYALTIGPTTIEATGSGQLLENGPQYQAVATLSAKRIAHDSAELRADGVNVRLPLAFFVRDDPDLEASLDAASRTATIDIGKFHSGGKDGQDLPGMTVSAARTDDRVEINANWPLHESAKVSARGELKEIFDQPHGGVRIDWPETDLAAAKNIRAVLEQFIGFEPSGKMSISGKVDVKKGLLTSAGTLRLNNVALEREVDDSSQKIAGINAEIAFDDLMSLRSRRGQTVMWRSMTFGDLEFAAGRTRFTLESTDSLLIEQFSTEVPDKGGRLWTSAFRMDITEPEVHAELFCEELRLDEWVVFLTNENVTGTGRLFGRVPIDLTWSPEFDIRLGDGFLHARGDGTLQLIDEQTAKQYLAGIRNPGWFDLSGVAEGEAKRRLIGALQDLEYNTLTFDLIPEDEQTLVRIFIAGQGKRPPNQAIGGLELNVRGVEDALREALR